MANCVSNEYLSYAAFEAAVEAVDDTKFLASFVFTEAGTGKPKIVLVTKT